MKMSRRLRHICRRCPLHPPPQLLPPRHEVVRVLPPRFCNMYFHNRLLSPLIYHPRRWHILPTLPPNDVGLDFYYLPPRPMRLPNGHSYVPMPFGRWQWNWPMPRRLRQVFPKDLELHLMILLEVEVEAEVVMVVVEWLLDRHQHPCIGSTKMPCSIILRQCIMDFVPPMPQLLLAHQHLLLLLLPVQPIPKNWIHTFPKWTITFGNRSTWPRRRCKCIISILHHRHHSSNHSSIIIFHIFVYHQTYRNGMLHTTKHLPMKYPPLLPVPRNEGELLLPPRRKVHPWNMHSLLHHSLLLIYNTHLPRSNHIISTKKGRMRVGMPVPPGTMVIRNKLAHRRRHQEEEERRSRHHCPYPP